MNFSKFFRADFVVVHHAQYQRLITQAVLWSLKLPVPKVGVKLQIKPEVLELPRR